MQQLYPFCLSHEKVYTPHSLIKWFCLLGVNVAKIADFGTAKETENSLKTMIGSPMFMAPEILRSETYSLSADVYR